MKSNTRGYSTFINTQQTYALTSACTHTHTQRGAQLEERQEREGVDGEKENREQPPQKSREKENINYTSGNGARLSSDCGKAGNDNMVEQVF